MSQTAAPAQSPAAAAPSQGTHHFILTLQASLGSGFQVFTTQGTHTPPQAWTRQDFYEQVRSSVVREHPELSRANVLFFDVQPNRL
ncbi:hypothetical protein AB0D10_39840 [Kitasatospora sp. NPDC048545]|uniref:hypothetical protein n=1 Tax=Kitasatospora sp. NPDC048545 TaxID=3157208 RepID=UPI0033DD5EC1